MNASEVNATSNISMRGTGDGESLSTVRLVQLALEVTICVLTVLGNLMTVLAVFINPSLRRPTNYLIINLAIVDLLVGAIAIPFSAIAENGFPKDNFYGCLVINCLVVTFTQVSFSNLLAIALEILVAVRYPLHYRSIFTGRTVSVICALLWLSGGLLGFIPLMGWNLGPPANGLCSFIAVIDLRYWVYVVFFGWSAWIFLVVFAIYSVIFVIIRRQLNYRTKRGMVARHTIRRGSAGGGNGGEGPTESGGISKPTIKAAKRMSVIVLAFAVTWIPLNIHNTLKVLCSLPACSYSYYLVVVFILLTHANSAVNPLVYALSHPQFKAAYCALLCCGRCRYSREAGSNGSLGAPSGTAGASRNGGGGGGARRSLASTAVALPIRFTPSMANPGTGGLVLVRFDESSCQSTRPEGEEENECTVTRL